MEVSCFSLHSSYLHTVPSPEDHVLAADTSELASVNTAANQDGPQGDVVYVIFTHLFYEASRYLFCLACYGDRWQRANRYGDRMDG